MTTQLVVGVDGSQGGVRALDHAIAVAKALQDAHLTLVCVIEWSPYSFTTAEENAQRSKRREEEIAMAKERVLDPALSICREAGIEAEAVIRHGDAADILSDIAEDRSARQIVVARKAERGIRDRLFGSVASNLVQSAPVPVTIVP